MMKKTMAAAIGVLAATAALDASAAPLNVNTGTHTWTGNVNGVGAAARYAADGSADVGLGAGGAGLQYHHWLNGWSANDTWQYTGETTAMYDPMRAANGDASFYGVGFQSLCQGGECAGDPGTSFGWNHTSQHILFTLTGGAQDLTITLSGDSSLAPAVTGKHGPNVNVGNLGTNLLPAMALYTGKSTTGINDSNHTFEWGPGSSHWGGISYLDGDINAGDALTITKTFTNLAPGDYTLYIGGNINNPGTPGGGGKNFYINASSVVSTVPVPAAVWLFGSALAGMGIIGRRKDKADA